MHSTPIPALVSSKDLGDLVVTADGSLTLKDPTHGECYHSSMGAKREAFELYIKASGLHARWNDLSIIANQELPPIISVLDVGLGLGYNAGTTIEAWMSARQATSLGIQSLEIEAALVKQIASGNAPWQVNWNSALLQVVRSLKQKSIRDGSIWTTTVQHPSQPAFLQWNIQVGDAQIKNLVPDWSNGWDYIWQDPFSPEKNPGMWTSLWFQKLRKGAGVNSLLMTYSVARKVRDALTEAGWRWEKFPSQSGIKRHWLRATSQI